MEFLQGGRLLLWFEGDEYTASVVAEDPNCKGALRRAHDRALGYSTGRGDVRIFVGKVNSLASVSRTFAPARYKRASCETGTGPRTGT